MVMQAWFVFAVIPQEVRSGEPVIIDQAILASDGRYVGCFEFLSVPGGLGVHQDESFWLSWTVSAPANASPSCTVHSISAVLGPANVIGSNLPVTIYAGGIGAINVAFAPLNYPYWGGETVRVVETNT
jgi:hypothetical protein